MYQLDKPLCDIELLPGSSVAEWNVQRHLHLSGRWRYCACLSSQRIETATDLGPVFAADATLMSSRRVVQSWPALRTM